MRRLAALFFMSMTMTAHAQQPYLVDWDATGEESVKHLVNLIQIDTSNPPGNETDVVRYLQKVLAAEDAEKVVTLVADLELRLLTEGLKNRRAEDDEGGKESEA